MPPAHWAEFLNEVTKLMLLTRDHSSFDAVIRMNLRSVKKMATVARMQRDDVFIQTGLVQRVLGFGWRLFDMDRDVNLIRPALRLMPVSVGVAFLTADLETILQRNRDRERVKETAHENRSFQVPLMLPAIEVAKDELRKRGVPVIEIDTGQPIDVARRQLTDFAEQTPFDTASDGRGGEMAVLQKPPVWWQ